MSRPRVLTPATGLNSLPEVAIGQVSSFLQFKEVVKLLGVSKITQEAVYFGETVLVFPREATDAAVITMVPKFHNLKSVSLAACHEVTDAGVQALAEKFPGLESVDLRYCPKVTDAGVKALAEKCPGLESVDLAYCSKVTDAGVNALAEKCPGLKLLKLADWRRSTRASS